MKDDLISRQAAIDAIEKHLYGVLKGQHYDEGIALGYEAAHRHIQDVINNLPSAQPVDTMHSIIQDLISEQHEGDKDD